MAICLFNKCLNAYSVMDILILLPKEKQKKKVNFQGRWARD